jgi:hypothetical protein
MVEVLPIVVNLTPYQQTVENDQEESVTEVSLDVLDSTEVLFPYVRRLSAMQGLLFNLCQPSYHYPPYSQFKKKFLSTPLYLENGVKQNWGGQ